MKPNFSESATVVAHRADGMAASLSDRAVPLRRDVHGQPVYADWGGGRPQDAIEGIPQDHLIAQTLDRCVGRSLRQQAKGRAVLLTSVGTGPEFDDQCAVVQELREDRQPRQRAFCSPEQGSQGAPAGAASGRRAGAFTKGLPVLRGAAAALFALYVDRVRRRCTGRCRPGRCAPPQMARQILLPMPALHRRWMTAASHPHPQSPPSPRTAGR